MDVLLKQDVDLGFSLILPDATTNTATTAKAEAAAKANCGARAAGKTLVVGKSEAERQKVFCSGGGGATDDTEDDIQKWNALLEIKSDDEV